MEGEVRPRHIKIVSISHSERELRMGDGIERCCGVCGPEHMVGRLADEHE